MADLVRIGVMLAKKLNQSKKLLDRIQQDENEECADLASILFHLVNPVYFQSISKLLALI